MESLPTATERNFSAYLNTELCDGCSVPCCRMLLIPHSAPSTFMELDYIRFMLGFPNLSILLSKDGTWQIQIESTCMHLVAETNHCELHDTPEKPKTCVFYNPYQCYYKKNFTGQDPTDILRLNKHRFDRLADHIEFDEKGDIQSVPPFNALQLIVEGKSHPSTE